MANEDKLWTQPALYAIAKQAALEAIQSQGGLALPCRVIAVNPNDPATGDPLGYSFVQVQFEVNMPYTKPDGTAGTYTLPPLILPKAEGQWVRSSTQVGDLGVTQAVDTSHGAVSGMSPGVPNAGTDYGNLSTLVFVPIANTDFGAPPDPNKVWVNGPDGTVTSDTAQTATHVVSVPTPGTPGTIASTIHNAAGAGATTVQHILDGVNNAIKHAVTNASGTVQTIVDGAGNAISHVVPTGGLVGVGVLAASSTAAQAAYNKTHITSLATNMVQSRIQDLSTMAAALITAGVPNAAGVTTALLALAAAPSPLGILSAVFPLPTIPTGSNVVRLP